MASEETRCRVLTRLSEDEDIMVRGQVASNKDMPAACACDILARLSKDPAWTVRREIVDRPAVPESCACEIFTDMIKHESYFHTRMHLGYRDDIPKECACEIFGALSDDSDRRNDSFVLTAVASNANIPDECACRILTKLSESKGDGGDARRYALRDNGLFLKCAETGEYGKRIRNALKDSPIIKFKEDTNGV